MLQTVLLLLSALRRFAFDALHVTSTGVLLAVS